MNMKIELEIKDEKLIDAIVKYALDDGYGTTRFSNDDEDKYLFEIGEAIKKRIYAIVETDDRVTNILRKWLTDEKYLKYCIKQVVKWHSGYLFEQINARLQNEDI